MLTKYTAAEIEQRCLNLTSLLESLNAGKHFELTLAQQEQIIMEAQEALQTYHDFLVIRERIPDRTMQNANLLGAVLFGEYVDTDDAEKEYKRRVNSIYGKKED